NSTYRLRSIYVDGGSLNLSAKTGGHITFYDSVYGGTTALNADYTDAEGKTQQAKGTIIFSGQYTKTHLDAILEANHEGRVATDEEILNSRTSTLGNTTLYGGTLQVVDGAILSTRSLTVEAGSRARVLLRDAELKGTAGITFNAGTTLQVQGDSLITGDVLLLAGSSLDIDGAITINGGLTLGQGLTLSGDILADIRNLQAGQSLTLVSGLESLAVQTQELVRSVEYTTVLSGQELSAADYFSNLQGVGTLVLEYNEASGTMSITATVPEPATATLSLLALAGFCARRRRK
ncbi:MAG: PEP-CTERM sorting domain-containing protein, partial [Akkermansia sp.]|nr:PEP-CTERM sorting domain-containing protein [Akkermansia sp.]